MCQHGALGALKTFFASALPHLTCSQLRDCQRSVSSILMVKPPHVPGEQSCCPVSRPETTEEAEERSCCAAHSLTTAYDTTKPSSLPTDLKRVRKEQYQLHRTGFNHSSSYYCHFLLHRRAPDLFESLIFILIFLFRNLSGFGLVQTSRADRAPAGKKDVSRSHHGNSSVREVGYAYTK